jgi:hypothetical protein
MGLAERLLQETENKSCFDSVGCLSGNKVFKPKRLLNPKLMNENGPANADPPKFHA